MDITLKTANGISVIKVKEREKNIGLNAITKVKKYAIHLLVVNFLAIKYMVIIPKNDNTRVDILKI